MPVSSREAERVVEPSLVQARERRGRVDGGEKGRLVGLSCMHGTLLCSLVAYGTRSAVQACPFCGTAADRSVRMTRLRRSLPVCLLRAARAAAARRVVCVRMTHGKHVGDARRFRADNGWRASGQAIDCAAVARRCADCRAPGHLRAPCRGDAAGHVPAGRAADHAADKRCADLRKVRSLSGRHPAAGGDAAARGGLRG